MVKIKIEQTIDFTKMKPDGKKIITCQECGRTGELHSYKDGTKNIIHLQELETGIIPIWNIKDSCFIKAGNENH